MTLDGLHLTLISGFGAFVTAITAVAVTNWYKNKQFRNYVTIEMCDKFRETCKAVNTVPLSEAIKELCREVKLHGALMRLIAEKNGITQEEQIKLESLVDKNIGR